MAAPNDPDCNPSELARRERLWRAAADDEKNTEEQRMYAAQRLAEIQELRLVCNIDVAQRPDTFQRIGEARASEEGGQQPTDLSGEAVSRSEQLSFK